MCLKKWIFVFLILTPFCLKAQMDYQYAGNKTATFGTYSRIGVDWSFENNGSIGRRLNLNNMGSIGGRLEEQDYLELAAAFQFKPVSKKDSTKIYVQTRLAAYSRSLSLFANTSTTDPGGLTIGIPELFIEIAILFSSVFPQLFTETFNLVSELC